MADSFVYCWTDHLKNMLYVGYHKGSQHDGYISSSKRMMVEYEKRPHDFTRQIIATGNVDDMRILEFKILNSVDARKNIDFYNMTNGHLRYGCHDENSRKKLSLSKTGVPRSIESRLKQSKTMTGKNNHFYGKKHTEEFCKKRSESMKKAQIGGNNSNAKSVCYSNKYYSTMKEMSLDTGFSMGMIRKMIKNKTVEIV